MSTSKILLLGGTLLIHDEEGHVKPRVSDLLVEGSIISKIDKNIKLPSAEREAVREIDCRGKIVSPGFINTHHHLSTSQFKGKPADQSMAEIFACHHTAVVEYTTIDGFWGELSAAMQCLDCGTTTVVDHSHPVMTKQARVLLQALATSGIRGVFCFNPANPIDLSLPGALDQFRSHAAASPFGNGRVQLGFAIDNLFLPGEVLKPFYQALRAAGAKLISSHGPGGVPFGVERPSMPQLLDRHSLLGKDVLISHANYPKPEDHTLFQKSGASLSSTVTSEMHMGLDPLAMRPEFYGSASFGTDGNLLGSEYMPRQMSALLAHARLQRSEALAKENHWSRKIGPTVEEVFNLATLGGARAIGMVDQIGQLRVGFKADLLIFEGSSPSMLVAAQDNPLAAVVMYSSIRDLETVIVDGIIRKEGGKLLDVETVNELNDPDAVMEAGKRLSWADVARGTSESYLRLHPKIEAIDMGNAVKATIDMYRMNRSALLEPL